MNDILDEFYPHRNVARIQTLSVVAVGGPDHNRFDEESVSTHRPGIAGIAVSIALTIPFQRRATLSVG